jgi:uncharacterized protein (AIM24 family)
METLVTSSIPSPSTSASASFGTVRATTTGELVPVTEVSLAQNDSIFFEHHIFLWKDPGVTITAKVMKGVGKRILAGLPVYVTEAHGPGRIAFSRDSPGQVLFLEMRPGTQVHVREHQFLFSTSGLNYSYFRVKGISNILYGHTGMFMDTFEGSGILALHGYGNVFVRNLGAGEMIDVEPGGFLYKDASVQMATNSMGLKSGLFGGFTFAMNRFVGPGRLAIQSMPFHLSTGE